jgi:signal peptidase
VAIARGTCVGLLAALLGLMFWSVLPAVAGWRAQVVLTGSMRPRIQPGDLVLAAPLHPGDLQRGRILLFRDPAHPRRTLVHRLVRFDANSDLITKGDANQSEDSTPVPAGSVLGLPRLRVPFIGRPVVWVRQGRTGNLLVASTLLTAAGALLLWPAGTTPRPGEPVRSHRRRGQRG